MISSFCFKQLIAPFAIMAVVALAPISVWAAGSHSGGHGHGTKMAIGEPGNADEVTKTLTVKMFDNYYEPASIEVKKDQTIRFIVENAGEFVHEFNIGTNAMHASHQDEMMKMMENGVLEVDKINHHMMKMGSGHAGSMAHDDPNSVLLEPGKSSEIIWKFAEVAKLEFACNVPGHYESGMKGAIKFDGHR